MPTHLQNQKRHLIALNIEQHINTVDPWLNCLVISVLLVWIVIENKIWKMFGSALNRYTDSIAVDSSKSNLKLANETEKGEKRQSFSFNFGITKDFLDNTSLHGLKFIGLTHITMFERYFDLIFHSIFAWTWKTWNFFRMFFGLSFVLVLFCSGYFISNVFIRWSTAPIIVTVGPTNMLIPDMPFPAVTVCNLNKGEV